MLSVGGFPVLNGIVLKCCLVSLSSGRLDVPMEKIPVLDKLLGLSYSAVSCE